MPKFPGFFIVTPSPNALFLASECGMIELIARISSLFFASIEPDVGSIPSMGKSAILFTDRLELGTLKPFASL